MVPTHQKVLAELTSTIGIIYCKLQKKTISYFFRENEAQKGKKTHTHLQCVL